MGTISDWIETAGTYRGLVTGIVIPLAIALLLLLLWVSFSPLLPAVLRRGRPVPEFPADVAMNLGTPTYSKILVPLDHTHLDRAAVSHAAAMARTQGAKLYLLHVEEDVTSQVYGSLSSTAEVEAGLQYLSGIVTSLRTEGIEVEAVVQHSNAPRAAIIRVARELKPDLVVMAGHGHKGLKDLIFGTTINAVRHAIETPLLVVREPKHKS
jgi:manganese transport protein